MASLLDRSSTEELNGDSLCECCIGINLQCLKSSLGYEHQPTFGSLILSSSTCVLCDLITKSVNRTLNNNCALEPSISEDLGPVRLVGAGRSLAQEPEIHRRCPEGSVEEFLLWREVAVIIGKELDRTRCFSFMGAQLVMVAAKDSAAEAAGVQAIQPNDRYAFSERNIQRIRKLLQSCRQGHRDCSLGFLESLGTKYYEKYGNSGLPSRLIDVTMEDQSEVRLVDVQGRHEYIALSYCWGKSQLLVTTKDNLAQMRMGIKISCLAKTIQDAIVFTRKLDVHYLWVDALCIVQKGDEGADWSHESQKMAFIYAQSYATLGAASVKGSDESFLFAPRSPFVEVPFRETAQSPSNGNLLFSVSSFDFAEDFEAATYGSPLAKRAWVKQERLFSRRTIHFTTRQIYWECRSIFWAENGEISGPLAYDGFKMAATFLQSIWLLGNVETDAKRAAAIHMFLRIWSELLDEYSELELTYPTDRLPGIAGLAQVASLVFPGRYLSGIWEQTLSSGLLWVPRRHPMRLVKKKCAPSWSWASTIDAIRSSGVSRLPGATDSRITLQQVLTSSNGSEILQVSGQIHHCSVSLEPEPKPARRRRKEAPEEEDNVLDYRFWPIFSQDSNDLQDRADNVCRFDSERGTQTEFFFLRLECSETMAFHHCRGLLLNCEKDIASGQISYTRVAVGWASHPVWHEAPSSIVWLK